MQDATVLYLRNLRFLNGGYCIQAEWFTGVRSWRLRRFEAVFVEFEHPTYGRSLIDTGYGPEVLRHWRHWPWCLLGLLTPTPKKQPFADSDYLRRQKLDLHSIERVFISHFHPDHIGGLKMFPQSRFIYRRSVWDRLRRSNSLRQLANGFVPGLIPDDFELRSESIEEDAFQNRNLNGNAFSCYDYFGDGTLVLVDLPGHALGHTGYVLRSAEQTFFYVVDAFWDRRMLDQNKQLPWISKRVASNAKEYDETNLRLRSMAMDPSWQMLACHCPATQSYVTPLTG